jgi:hypothetical protein
MIKSLRVAIVLITALTLCSIASSASAQMMHYTLFVTVATQDGSAIPAGEVCITGEDNVQICQDIPAGTPDGHQFIFEGLDSGDYSIDVSADGYFTVSEDIKITDVETYATLTLTLPDPANPTPGPNLPNTGVGTTQGGDSTSFLLITGLLGAAGALGAGSMLSRRAQR